MDYEIIMNNNKDWLNIYNFDVAVANSRNFQIYYNILHDSKSDSFKSDFASNVLDIWINFYVDNPTNENKEQCRYFINFINNKDIIDIIKKTINNDINRLIKIFNLFDYNDILNYKNQLIFNDINCLDFMVKRFGHYDKETVVKTLIDMGINYYFVNDRVIEWIHSNYYDFITANIDFILIELIKHNDYANIDNAYYIMEYLIKNIEMEYKTKMNIFKSSIYNNNKFVFELFVFFVFDNISPFNIFKFVCMNVNSNAPISNTLVLNAFYYYHSDYQNDNVNILNNTFYNKLKEKGQHNIIKWFDKYFDSNFNPLIDFFFIENNINIKKVSHNDDCIICYENKDKIISLSCHSTHNICEDCMKIWYKTHDTCPMCRSNIDFSKCNECIV